MKNLTYIGLSQQMALYNQMDMTANNIANMNTPGFKSQSLLFKEYLNKTPSDTGDKISQVQNYGAYRNTAQGPLTQTSNKLDVAIQGSGYFAVQTPQGTQYTRNGSFSLNANGEIVTQSGNQVLGTSGPLTVQQGASQINIMADGEVSTDKGTIGTLKLVSFSNEQALSPVGNSLYDAQQAVPVPVDKPHVMQGMLEGSNVQPITEMNRMLNITRMYQSVQHMLTTDHDEQRTMIQHLTQA